MQWFSVLGQQCRTVIPKRRETERLSPMTIPPTAEAVSKLQCKEGKLKTDPAIYLKEETTLGREAQEAQSVGGWGCTDSRAPGSVKGPPESSAEDRFVHV